jgi:peptidoglycan/xylan/chitin deacetylase (PgdA/CDA1 family)
MDPVEAYSPDRSLKGKLRRRLMEWVARRPARLTDGRPMIAFTFDDAPASAVHEGAARLEAHGARGTYFVSAGLAGRDGPMGRYATQEELMAAATAGHDLACHSFSHLDCGAATGEAIAADAERNQAVLAEWGAAPSTSFAYPYGDVSLAAKRVLAPRYGLLRALHHGLIEDGSDLNQAPAIGIEGPDGEAVALRWLDRAADRKAWLIVYTHDVTDTPSPWGCTPAALDRLISAARNSGFDIVTVSEGLQRVGAEAA